MLYFNSIKVRLEPIVWGYITSLFSIGFVDAKLINLIEKMSMGIIYFYAFCDNRYIYWCYNKSKI